MPSVTITHQDGSTDTIPATVGWQRKRELGNMRRVDIDVQRSLAEPIPFERKQDKVDLGGIDTLRLVDIQTGGSTWTLVCYSFEWDANRAGYTSGGDAREGTDANLVSGLVGEVGSWSAGSINSYTGPLAFVFNHAARHEALRRIEKNVPGEIQFRDEGTVDYVQRLGSDRTGSVELSGAAGTIENRIEITKRGRELDGTHIRVLGAHEGEAQIYANLVPEDDPESYSNRVDYQTGRWSPGDARDWDRWTNKDVTDQATIEAEAESLGAEITEELVEVETTVSGVDLNVGDSVRVVKPSSDLDRSMRVHRITTKAGGRNDTESGASVVDDVLLSTRTVMRSDEGEDLRDIQRFNSGYQGETVVVNSYGGHQTVTESNDYQFGMYYPGEVEYEHRVKLHLQAGRYAAPLAGVIQQEDGEYLESLQADGTDTVTASNSFQQLSHSGLTWPRDVGRGGMALWTTTIRLTNQTGPLTADFRVRDTVNGGVYPAVNANDTYRRVTLADDYTTVAFVLPASFLSISSEFELECRIVDGSPSYDLDYQTSVVSSTPHTHDPEPGFIDDFSNITSTQGGVFSPADCHVFVEGSQVTTSELFPSNLVAYEDGVGDSDWSNTVALSASNVSFTRGSSQLEAATTTTAGDGRAEGIWYWSVFPTHSYSPLSRVDHIRGSGGGNTTLNPDSSNSTSGVALTVSSDVSETLAETPSQRVIGVQTSTLFGNEEAFGDLEGPPFPDFSDDLYLKYHVFGEDGDNCALTIRYVDVLFNYGYNEPHEETVDLRGELTPGEFNKLRVSSSRLGGLVGNLDADVYRQILGNG